MKAVTFGTPLTNMNVWIDVNSSVVDVNRTGLSACFATFSLVATSTSPAFPAT